MKLSLTQVIKNGEEGVDLKESVRARMTLSSFVECNDDMKFVENNTMNAWEAMERVTRLQKDLFMLESGLLTFGCLKSIYNECKIISYYAYVITCI